MQKSLISVVYTCFSIYRWVLKACAKYLFFFYLQVHARLNISQKLGFLYCTPPVSPTYV